MALMLLTLSAETAALVFLTFRLHRRIYSEKDSISLSGRLLLGVLFGICSICCTHAGIDYGDILINVRDLPPLLAGLFFHPVSGIIAGLIGGIECYIAGSLFGLGTYTAVACSISAALSGFLAALLHITLFERRRPTAFHGFFTGAVIEVSHMYLVFLTHRNDLTRAYAAVKICSIPMILFTGIGLVAVSLLIDYRNTGLQGLFARQPSRNVPISKKIRFWMLIVLIEILLADFMLTFQLQTQKSLTEAETRMEKTADDFLAFYRRTGSSMTSLRETSIFPGTDGSFDIAETTGNMVIGTHAGKRIDKKRLSTFLSHADKPLFEESWFKVSSACLVRSIDEGLYLILTIPSEAIYESRDADAYETVFSYIFMLSVIYVILSIMMQAIVTDELESVNGTLQNISKGDLNEKVTVYSSKEFASLTGHINKMVDSLKELIEAAEKRMEHDLNLARSIQASALPHSFSFPKHDFKLYASMTPAKHVGGDFYDFFFLSEHRLALVIADVSGKGIPASLFMMQSKTTIRSMAERGGTPAEILDQANRALKVGNDNFMFVTVWLGIVDLTSGELTCANAGHEYPLLIRKAGTVELFKDPHAPMLGLYNNLKFEEYQLTLHPGDTLFVYTDGVAEAIDEEQNQYRTDRLCRVAEAHKADLPDVLLPAVLADIRSFAGRAEQFDDITMLAFRYPDI